MKEGGGGNRREGAAEGETGQGLIDVKRDVVTLRKIGDEGFLGVIVVGRKGDGEEAVGEGNQVSIDVGRVVEGRTMDKGAGV